MNQFHRIVFYESKISIYNVVYEGGSCLLQARSLWRLELARIKWCGGYINWYHPMRIKHITTGMYLGVNEENQLMLIRREDANLANSCFYLREEKDDNKVNTKRVFFKCIFSRFQSSLCQINIITFAIIPFLEQNIQYFFTTKRAFP